MNTTRYIAYRLLWTIVGVWTVLTGLFLAFAVTPDTEQYNVFNGLTVAEYRELHNLDAPLHERYLTWMGNFLTFDLGTTAYGDPIADLLVEATTVTLTYLVPAVVLALVVGVGVGMLAALNRDSLLVRVVRAVSYAGFAVPTFIAADAMFFVAVEHFSIFTLEYDPELTLFTSRNLVALTLPASVLTVNMIAVQFRYARTESIGILQADFVRTLRANGAGTLDIARHVFRNAASSLLALFVSELVGVIFVVVVVIEVIFGVPGFGQLLYRGIQSRDIGIILATTVFPIVFVMVGNLSQDVAHALLDPRVTSE